MFSRGLNVDRIAIPHFQLFLCISFALDFDFSHQVDFFGKEDSSLTSVAEQLLLNFCSCLESNITMQATDSRRMSIKYLEENLSHQLVWQNRETPASKAWKANAPGNINVQERECQRGPVDVCCVTVRRRSVYQKTE